MLYQHAQGIYLLESHEAAQWLAFAHAAARQPCKGYATSGYCAAWAGPDKAALTEQLRAKQTA
jgi:hypothetical protein